jgi:Spy/CpxP family protein refolding chaperone
MRLRSFFLPALLLFASFFATAQQASDPLGEALFAPELVMQHQAAIGLSDQQKDALKTELRQAQLDFTDLQWKLQDEVEQMIKVVEQPKIDEKLALGQLEKVLTAERDVKRRQITVMVQIKNLLSLEQQDQLRSLRASSKR